MQRKDSKLRMIVGVTKTRNISDFEDGESKLHSRASAPAPVGSPALAPSAPPLTLPFRTSLRTAKSHPHHVCALLQDIFFFLLSHSARHSSSRSTARQQQRPKHSSSNRRTDTPSAAARLSHPHPSLPSSLLPSRPPSRPSLVKNHTLLYIFVLPVQCPAMSI